MISSRAQKDSLNRFPLRIGATFMVMVLAQGCGPADSLTPEQSRTQVVDAAKEIVATLQLPVVSAYFWRSSCNDQGDPPFRGSMRIAYPLAQSSEASREQMREFTAKLRAAGWSTPGPDFHTHATGLVKGGVSATFGPQAVGIDTNGIELLGECRDVTTTKEDAPAGEDIDLR